MACSECNKYNNLDLLDKRFSPLSPNPYDKNDPSQDPYRCIHICNHRKNGLYIAGRCFMWFFVLTVFIFIFFYSLKIQFFNDYSSEPNTGILFIGACIFAFFFVLVVYIFIGEIWR